MKMDDNITLLIMFAMWFVGMLIVMALFFLSDTGFFPVVIFGVGFVLGVCWDKWKNKKKRL